MLIIPDTHLLLWFLVEPEKLSKTAQTLIDDPVHNKLYSVVSLWETTIKFGLRRPDFLYDPHVIRRAARQAGLRELPIRGDHALAVTSLPPIHRDPFDRLLIAQANVEGATLLTLDTRVAAYGGTIQLV